MTSITVWLRTNESCIVEKTHAPGAMNTPKWASLPEDSILYTDPGSGALLWQVVAAGVFGAMFYVRKIFAFFRGKSQQASPQVHEMKDEKLGKL